MSFDDDDDTTEAHERRITRCKTCRARIIYLPTATPGKRMPVDADTVEPDDDEFDGDRHVTHFATCPDSNHHRRRR